jgi:hypothetical protein
MSMKVPNMKSLNETLLSGMSIDELDNRLQSEDLDVRTEMWTSCSCYCANPCHITCTYPCYGC